MSRVIKFFDSILSISIVLLPFSMAIANAPLNIFSGIIVASYLLKKAALKQPIRLDTKVAFPLFIFFFITCISIVNSVDLKDTLKGGIGRLFWYISILFILSESIANIRLLKKIFTSVCLGLGLTVINEIWQIVVGKDFIRGYEPIINIGLIRATASFPDANVLGTYLSALAPLLFGLTLYYYKGMKKALLVLLSLLVVIGIVVTYSRPTLLATYIVFLFFSIIRKDKRLLIALLILLLTAPLLAPRPVKEWARQNNYNPLRVMCNDDRIAIYRNSFNMIKSHPFLGVGANTFMKNYRHYKEKPEYLNQVTSDYCYAHNNFFQMAAEIGLVGLAVFAWFLYTLFKFLFRVYTGLRDEFLKITCLSLIAAEMSFLINGLTESSFYSSRIAVIFWYFAGICLGLKIFIPKDAL